MMISNQDKKLLLQKTKKYQNHAVWRRREKGEGEKQIKLCFVSNFTDDGGCKARKSNVFIQIKPLVQRGWRLVNVPHPGW